MRKIITTCLMISAALRAGESVSVWDGVFVAEQADRGKKIFAEQCAACHGDTLKGRNGPPLVGEVFSGNWNGLSVDDLFEYINKSMPRGKTGTLTREQTADLMAYVFSVNGMPAGKANLPTEAAALQKIRFEGSKPTL